MQNAKSGTQLNSANQMQNYKYQGRVFWDSL